MKNIHLLNVALFAFAISGTTALHAQEGQESSQSAKAVLESFDKDGDGRLSDAEGKAAADWFNNHLAEKEPSGCWDKYKSRMISKYDTDGDGQISAEEKKIAWEDWKKKMTDRRAAWKKQGEEMKTRFMTKYDADGDGAISAEEYKAARENWRQKGEEMKTSFMNKYDTDGDGTLSGDEKQAMKKLMVESINEMLGVRM